MADRTVNLRGKEWEAEGLAGEITALLNDINERQQQIEALAYHRAGFPAIHEQAIAQSRAIEKLLGIYKGATANIMAVILDVEPGEAMRIIKEANSK